MANETSSTESSLSLHDVLEAEFVSLHGDLPPDYPSASNPEKRLEALCTAVHALKEKHAERTALCISGGGIRSATFGLGVLQGLARCGLLDKFHYLSTVSGGGYIGSWLSAWIKHHTGGISGVAAELKRRPESIFEPEPPPIRHLRQFSNYLSPRASLTSMDFWTLVATFIRNMFLNWLVLISLLAAVMMIPRLYLAAMLVSPDWSAATDQATLVQIIDWWNLPLNTMLAVGLVLVAISMAYAIVDVPSTGNMRLPQRRFLIFRQLPLILAALILAEWWAVFRTVHGSDLFLARDWLPRFIVFFLACYLAGGVLALVVLSFRQREKKPLVRRLINSVWRLGMIVIAAAIAGICLWAIAIGMFLASPIPFTLNRPCEATQIPWNKQKLVLPQGTSGLITRIDPSYIIQAGEQRGRISATDLGPLHLKPGQTLPVQVKLKKDFEAVPEPWRKERMKLAAGTQILVRELDRKVTIETAQGRGWIGEDQIGALDLPPNRKLSDQFPTPAPANNALAYVCLAPALLLAVLLLVNFLFTGLASWVTQDEDREWWGRSAAWILVTVFAWIVLNTIVLWGAQAISATPNQLDVFFGEIKATQQAKGLLGAFGGVTGLASALLAFRSKLSRWLGEKAAFHWLLIIVAALFLVLLSIIISWLLVLLGAQAWAQRTTNWILGKQAELFDPNSWQVQLFVIVFLTGAMLVVGIAMGFFINANKFSLHATYRNRLIRAYLAASRDQRSPNPFTGFDREDNFPLCELRPEKPLHIINGALNLVKGEQLAWQERKAESFTMSRLHCGSWHIGYRSSSKYGDEISLGTAMAISGAAANPNMGYHSSPVVGFLMTLLNLRLGWWLGNPGPAGRKTWTYKGPGYSVGPLFSESIGDTTDHYKYVNLSDGGHFDNLGLYEMVLRRCHFIVVSDAGEDLECSFVDLGEVVRKIRIDLGIPIEFGEPRMTIYPRSAQDIPNPPGGHNCAIGRIRYSAMDGDNAPDGVIIYVKPACYGDEPRDIYEYFKTNPTFPHETTADQFFSESQFESYRMLGAYTMGKLCAECGGDFGVFIRSILKQHLNIEPPQWLAPLIQEAS